MRVVRIQIFKSWNASGNDSFCYQIKPEIVECGTLANMADLLLLHGRMHYPKDKLKIYFKVPVDIELGSSPRRYLPLSSEEQNRVWEALRGKRYPTQPDEL